MTIGMIEGMTLPAGARMGPNCGVTAVAVSAGVSFEEAWAVLKRIGERDGRWRGGTNATQREEALRALSVPFENVPLPRRMTLETWVRRYARAGERYMVRTTHHVQMVLSGFVLDQSGLRRVSDYPSRRKMVTLVTRILPVQKQCNPIVDEVTIYRVEAPSGDGPWQSGFLNTARRLVAEKRGKDSFYDTGEPDPSRHPGPSDEPNLRALFSCYEDGKQWFFGFASMEALVAWFDSEALRAAFNELGARVVTYVAADEDVRQGSRQLVFRKKLARRVSAAPLPVLQG